MPKSVKGEKYKPRRSRRRRESSEDRHEISKSPQGVSEDYCFVCKDGGDLIVCDHKGCLKTYHLQCVGQDESLADGGEDDWICGRHSCLKCGKSSFYLCVGCPKAFCRSCVSDVGFSPMRGKKSICEECLKIALLVEEGLDVDSDGEAIDFKDRNTYECLFKEYWDIINETEGITLEDLHSADARLKKGVKKTRLQKSHSDSDGDSRSEEKQADSSDHEDSDIAQDYDFKTMTVLKRREDSDKARACDLKTRTVLKRHEVKKFKGPFRIEFFSWASKSLIEFLASIGVSTNEKLSQDNVTSIIAKYVQDNKLFHPEKKKKVICDEPLRSVLGRKSVNVYKIYDLLEGHFPENLDTSDEDEEEQEQSLEDEDANGALSSSLKRKWGSVKSSQQKQSPLENLPRKEVTYEDLHTEDAVFEVPKSCFASIIPENIKLVYLRRSLIEELVKQPESFERKVVGSFVRIRKDTFYGERSYQLLQVNGIKKILADETKMEVSLKLSDMPDDVPICMLSNEDFSEEECEELLQKVKSGLIKRPTVVDLEKKARYLHQDITKHRIATELVFLRNRIDLANEKGWRTKLFEYLERRKLLQSKEEQARLLDEAPKVIADAIEPKPDGESLEMESDHGDRSHEQSLTA